MAVLRNPRITVEDSDALGNGNPAHPLKCEPEAEERSRTLHDHYRKILYEAERSIILSVEMITPEQAARMLESSAAVQNRRVSPGTVRRYADFIARGEWTINGECLILGDDDSVYDGQHRLHGVIKSGTPAPFLVLRGLGPDAFKTLNQGKIRTAADTFHTMGKERSTTLSSALHWLCKYLADALMAKAPKPSNATLIGILAEHPAVEDSVHWVTERYQKGIHAPGLFSFLHYVCTVLKNHPDHESFFEQVLTGANIPSGSPAQMLSLRLNSIKKDKKRNTPLEVAAYIVKAWNATIERRHLSLLRWSNDEAFPVIL